MFSAGGMWACSNMLTHCCRSLHCELQARVHYVLLRDSLTMSSESESRQHFPPSHTMHTHRYSGGKVCSGADGNGPGLATSKLGLQTLLNTL